MSNQQLFKVGQQVNYQGSCAADFNHRPCRFYVVGYQGNINPNGVPVAEPEPAEVRYIIEVREGTTEVAVLRGVRTESLVELHTVCDACNLDRHICSGCGTPVAHPSFCCIACEAL
jgi:hypothetical protein